MKDSDTLLLVDTALPSTMAGMLSLAERIVARGLALDIALHAGKVSCLPAECVATGPATEVVRGLVSRAGISGLVATRAFLQHLPDDLRWTRLTQGMFNFDTALYTRAFSLSLAELASFHTVHANLDGIFLCVDICCMWMWWLKWGTWLATLPDAKVTVLVVLSTCQLAAIVKARPWYIRHR